MSHLSFMSVTPVVMTSFGSEAFDAFERTLHEMRGGSPLRPVDVAVPSAFVGVTIRRRLARPGLVGVRFAALPRLITDRASGQLALAGKSAITAAQRRAATRAVLVASTGELGAAARRSSATSDVVARAFAELDEAGADEGALGLLASGGRWPAEIAELYAQYLSLTKDAANADAVIDAALGNQAQNPLLIYLPRRLTRPELRFCEGLQARGLLRVILGCTGEAEADGDIAAIRGRLAPGVSLATPKQAPKVELRTLPDADEEVRFAVRNIFAHLSNTPEARLDRIAIGYRASVPYARLISEQLSAAGLAHHAPTQRTLAQTVPGRALLGSLHLPPQWSRVAVLDWLRNTPIRADGRRLPVARWQRQAAEAGVTRGSVKQWVTKLEALALSIEASGNEEDEAEVIEQRAKHAADARRLAAFVTELAETVTAIDTAPTWREMGAQLRDALDRYLGGAQAAASWGMHADAMNDAEVRARCDVERDAYEQMIAVLDGLNALDELNIPPGPETLRDLLDQELKQQVREATGLGRGVLVGPLGDFAGADLDLLIIVGGAEGSYPPRKREHPLLRDAIRQQLALRTLAEERASERRDHLAVLSSAGTVVLTHPIADIRAQRGAEPAPWLLDTHVPRPTSKQQKQTASPSFAASVCDERLPAASVSEFDVRAAMAESPLSVSNPLVAAEPAFARGVDAVRQRSGGVFGPWTGGLTTPVPEAVTARINRKLSASSLQRYAECPFHYYLEYVLGVRALREPDEDKANAAERGTAVHAVLEQLVRRAITTNKQPTEAWSAAEHELAQQLLTEQANRMLAAGTAGRPLAWRVQVTAWRRQLRQVLLVDDAYRASRRSRPLDAEHSFGRDERPPLDIDLPSGPVQLTGSIDRVDQTADGELIIIDYKTGRSEKYKKSFPLLGDEPGVGTDLTERGKKLQLPLYALAARADFGTETTPLSAYYWFVDEGDVRRGGQIDDDALARFRDVLDTVVSGVREGAFPARPGEFQAFYRSFDSCSWCEFDRVCSRNRDDVWLEVSKDPRVKRYAELAEPRENGQ